MLKTIHFTIANIRTKKYLRFKNDGSVSTSHMPSSLYIAYGEAKLALGQMEQYLTHISKELQKTSNNPSQKEYFRAKALILGQFEDFRILKMTSEMVSE